MGIMKTITVPTVEELSKALDITWSLDGASRVLLACRIMDIVLESRMLENSPLSLTSFSFGVQLGMIIELGRKLEHNENRGSDDRDLVRVEFPRGSLGRRLQPDSVGLR